MLSEYIFNIDYKVSEKMRFLQIKGLFCIFGMVFMGVVN